VGYESGNTLMCDGKDLPWLQEVPNQSVWTDWGVTFRDVVILNVDNEWVTAYNVTDHDLSVPQNYEALKALLRDLADGI
jgi:hypothetical protein